MRSNPYAVKTDVAIDLSPTGRGQTAKLAGRIMLDGRPVQGARVRVSGSGARASATTDEYGDFETDDFLCQNGVRVRVTGPVTGEDGETDNVDLYNEQLKAGHLYVDSSRLAAAEPDITKRSPGRVSILGAKMNTVGRLLNATDYYGSLMYGTGMWFEAAMPSWIVKQTGTSNTSL